jgi:hypothetical protein
MDRCSETPDAHVVCVAHQFCETAEMLLQHVRQVAAPAALGCNAALAIELFLKSLNSRWSEHDVSSEFGEDALVITTTPNKKGHRLDCLFASLPTEIQDHLEGAYRSAPVCDENGDLKSILKIYSRTFERARYPFERRIGNDSRPIAEIVHLASFFRDAIAQLPVVRSASEG